MPRKPSYDDLKQKVEILEKKLLQYESLKQELKQSQEKHKTILDNIIEGYYEVDLAGNFVFFNHAMQQILGLEKTEMLGMNNREFMEKETARKVFNTFNRVYETGKPSKTFDWVLIRKGGEKRYIETSIALIRDLENNPRGFRGIARDITEHKKAELSLQESEKKYRTLVDNTPDLLYRTNMQGVITFISSAVYELSGFTVEEAIGMKMAEEVYAYPEERQDFLDELMTNGRVRNFEARLKKKDGSIWWASTNAVFITDKQGNVAGVEGVTRDISEQKAVETALRESEEKFRTAFMTSPDSLMLTRISDGMILDINKGFTDILGYTRKDAIHKTTVELNIWDDIKDRDYLVFKLIKHGVLKNFEAKFRTKDGVTITGSMSANVIQFNQEDVIMTLVRDITDQKRTQEVLIQSEKMLSVGGLAAGMAHEINNPLAGIMQNAQVISNRLSADIPANQKIAKKIGVPMESIVHYMEKRKIFDFLSSLRDAGKRAAEIVANILSFSRKEDSYPSNFNMKRLVDNTIEIAGNDYDLKKKFDFRKISIIREYDETDLHVECNGSNIQQVLLNILRNSAEALFEKKMTSQPAITIRINGEKNQVRIEIEDNGPGIDAKIQKRVFEPFFTTKPVGLGTGLGLSVSYFIITEIHNGRISVESPPDMGAKFIIVLPCKYTEKI